MVGAIAHINSNYIAPTKTCQGYLFIIQETMQAELAKDAKQNVQIVIKTVNYSSLEHFPFFL